MLWIKALAVWGVLLVAMICNGALREVLLKRWMGELRANQVSAATGAALILGIAAALWPWTRAQSAGIAWAVGGLWLGLTVAFEFGFGHFVSGASWSKLLADYDVTQGRLWPLVLLATLLAPPLTARLRGG